LFQKLADKPHVLSALADFASLLQQKGVYWPFVIIMRRFVHLREAFVGIDVSAGRLPSTGQMLALGADSEFRAAAKKVVEEMQKAGIDLSSQVSARWSFALILA
jgi:hypothetical protein